LKGIKSIGTNPILPFFHHNFVNFTKSFSPLEFKRSMEPIIHIGYPKTGTSWFQLNYFPLAKNAICINNKEVRNNFIKPNSFEFDSKHIRKKILTIPAKYVILSLEGFVGTTHNFGLHGYLTKEHALRIYEVFPNATILLFIRNQPDIIASTYLQYIRGGGTYNIKKYLFHKNYSGLNSLSFFSFKHFEYHNIIGFYKKIFGDGNIKIFLYEEFLENNLAFSRKLSEILNLDINHNELDFQKVNEGYRRLIKFLALISNRFTEQKMPNKYYLIHIPGWFRFSKHILNNLNKYSVFGRHLNSKDILNNRNYQFIYNYYKESNRDLILKYQLSKIAQYNYPL